MTSGPASVLVVLALRVTAADPLAAARSAYGEGDFAVALRLATAVESTATDDHLRAEVDLLEGECQAALGDVAGSEAAFRRALSADPEIALDADRTAADLVERLQSLRGRLHGWIDVISARAGGRVQIDGNEVGVTPLHAELPIGRHAVELAPSGSAPAKSVVVRDAETTSVALEPAAKVEPAGGLVASGSDRASPAGIAPFVTVAGGVAGLLGAGITAALLAHDRSAEVAWSNGTYAGPAPSSATVASARSRVTLEAIVTPACVVLGTAALTTGIYLLTHRTDSGTDHSSGGAP